LSTLSYESEYYLHHLRDRMGVGKTTFAREFLPNYANCRNFINADFIAQGMGPFSPHRPINLK